jgi:hypothetical protein
MQPGVGQKADFFRARIKQGTQPPDAGAGFIFAVGWLAVQTYGVGVSQQFLQQRRLLRR